MKNKAGLTGQTFPGRRIPGHWPYPAPEELAETEPVTLDYRMFLSFTPITSWPSSVGMAAPTLACRGFGLPALLLGLAAAVARPSASLARSLRLSSFSSVPRADSVSCTIGCAENTRSAAAAEACMPARSFCVGDGVCMVGEHA